MWLDYALLTIIALSALYSVFRGFVREILSLISWVMAFWIAIKFAPRLAETFADFISIPEIRFIGAFLLIFLLIMVGSIFISRLLVSLLQAGGLRPFDRLVGAGFGMARGIVIVTVLVLLAGQSPLTDEPAWQQSRMVPYLQKVAVWAADRVPREMLENVSARAHALL